MSSALHANNQTKRLAQETLASLHGTILLNLEVEEAEDSSAHDEKFHLGNVAADAGTGAVREGNESGLLASSQIFGRPTLGIEFLGIGTPNFLGAMDGIAGDGENIAGAESVTGDVDRSGALGDLTGQTHGGGAVNTHGFPDDPLQVFNILDHSVSGNVDIGGNGVVQGLLQFGDHTGGTEAPVQNSAGGVRGGVGAGDQLGEGLSGKFLAAEFVTVAVLSFHETSE